MPAEDLCWLPSDFTIHDDGATILSPYHSNLHPTLHQALYPIVKEVLSGSLPLFERVLGGD
jgi:hypothetical protein